MSWYEPENKQEQLLNSLLRPLSALYFLGTYFRLLGYQEGLWRSKRLRVPVISIGNLTVGGTGKTPITIDLARSFMQLGLKVGVLSRGYKRQSSDKMLLVADYNNVLVDALQAGDEPYLIANSAKGAVVIVSADRYEAGQMAVRDYSCDILILDDGFQHLKLARDFDVLVHDYNDDPERLHLLPAGRLREPFFSTTRADCLVISKLPDNPDPARLSAIRLMATRFNPRISILSCRFQVDSFQLARTKQKVAMTTRAAGTRVFAFCGIARPEGFFKHLEELGCVIVGQETFPDHHWLTKAELSRLLDQYKESGAEFLVTTEKDRVRLPEDFIEQVPLAELALTTSWVNEKDGVIRGIIGIPRLRNMLKREYSMDLGALP